MKKLRGLIAALFIFLSASAFITPKPLKDVSSIVLTSFSESFSSVTDVTWSQRENFYFADFKLNGVVAGAAFDEAGNLVATSRKLSMDQLPLNVGMAIQKGYQKFSVDAIVSEITLDGQTSYYFIARNQKFSVIAKADATGGISVEKRVRNKKVW